MNSQGLRAAPSESEEELVFYRRGDSERGRSKFVQFQCVKCHRVQADPDLTEPESETEAPLLGSFTSVHNPEELSQAILTPAHHTTSDKTSKAMPSDYEDRLTTQDLIDIITYLRTTQI